MGYNSYNISSEDTKLAWDMRQFYAQYSALYMVDYKKAEDMDDYHSMFRILNKWHNTICHEWCEDKEDVDFEKLKNVVVILSNEYENAYFGKDKNAKAVYEIETALYDMKRYLMRNMKHSGMFGQVWDDSGL
jgi:hypothetical protein